MSEAAGNAAAPTSEQPQGAPGQDTAAPAPQGADQPGTVTDGQNTAASTEQESVQTEAQETTEQREQRREGRFKRRLDYQKQERFRVEGENRALKERIAELEARGQQQQPGNQQPKREDFDNYEDYLDARQDWRDEQRRSKEAKERDGGREREQVQSRQTAANDQAAKQWSEREKAFEATTKDYQVKVEAFLDEDFASFGRDARTIIMESDVGPALLYHLAAHPEVADRISGMTPVRQVAELGKLEVALTTKPAKQPSNAPPPANVTGTGRSANSGYRDNMSQAEFRDWAKRQGMRLG